VALMWSCSRHSAKNAARASRPKCAAWPAGPPPPPPPRPPSSRALGVLTERRSSTDDAAWVEPELCAGCEERERPREVPRSRRRRAEGVRRGTLLATPAPVVPSAESGRPSPPGLHQPSKPELPPSPPVGGGVEASGVPAREDSVGRGESAAASSADDDDGGSGSGGGRSGGGVMVSTAAPVPPPHHSASAAACASAGRAVAGVTPSPGTWRSRSAVEGRRGSGVRGRSSSPECASRSASCSLATCSASSAWPASGGAPPGTACASPAPALWPARRRRSLAAPRRRRRPPLLRGCLCGE
jgi:hypothetical protein